MRGESIAISHDIRQGAWQRSDNMELKEIFVDKMKLRSQDVATKSRVRTIMPF